MSRKKRVSDAVELMDRWYGNIPNWDEMVAEEEFKMQVGQALYDLRNAVGMSQTDLARLIGANQATLSKVENADYNGNTIEVLKRVCFALHTKISVSCPVAPDRQPECRISLATRTSE